VPAGFVVLLIVAGLLYVPMVTAIYGAPQGDPAKFSGEDNYSVGWIQFFVMLFGIPLWLALGGMLLSAGRSGRMPAWARGPAMIVHIAAAITVWAETQVYIAADGGVSVIIPALLPPLIAGYAAAMRLPALSERLSPERVSRIALVASGIVMAAAIPLGFLDERNLPAHVARDAHMLDVIIAKQNEESAKTQAADEARFKALTPDSSLDDYLYYLYATNEGEPEHATALEGTRRVKSRQEDAARLLDQGRLNSMQELWQFDVQAAPGLCAAFDRAIQRMATDADQFDWNAGERLERQLPNIKFFAARHCDLDAGFSAAEARVRKITAVNQGDARWEGFLATLVQLHQKG
jgi:hypothetical protein